MTKCRFSDVCWRHAYTKFFSNNPNSIIVPTRQDIMLDGYIHPKCYPNGGIYCLNLPTVIGLNWCPDNEFCEEYKRAIVKYQAMSRRGRHNLRKVIPKHIREEVAAKAHYKCVYCGVAIGTKDPNTGLRIGGAIDHIIPLSKGGTDDPTNLCLACRPCNTKKGDNYWERPESEKR